MRLHDWLILGIGNPGPEYEGTRHNIGFEILDQLAAKGGLSFQEAAGPALIASGAGSRGQGLLIKPQSYVNRSGEALARFLGRQLAKFDPSRLLVVTDDLALDPGVLRLKVRGSDGGHNGLKSLIQALGTRDFPRLRVGIGGVPAEQWKTHVLSPFSPEERSLMDATRERATLGLARVLLGEDFLRVQEFMNRGSPPAEERVRGTGTSDVAACVAPVELAANHGRNRITGDKPVTNKLRKYEGMFLLNNSRLAVAEVTPVQRVTEILKRQEIEPLRIDVWDERRLAYPIKRQKRGTYVLTHFEAPGESIDRINRDVSLTEDVLRHMFVVHSKKFPEFKTAAEMEGARPRRDDDRGGSEGSRAAKASSEAPAPKAEEATKPAEPAAEPAATEELVTPTEPAKDGDATPAAEDSSPPAGDGEKAPTGDGDSGDA